MSFIDGRAFGSFRNNHRIKLRRSEDSCRLEGIFTWASMIFMIKAHWLRASKGCCNVAHCDKKNIQRRHNNSAVWHNKGGVPQNIVHRVPSSHSCRGMVSRHTTPGSSNTCSCNGRITSQGKPHEKEEHCTLDMHLRCAHNRIGQGCARVHQLGDAQVSNLDEIMST